MRTKLIIKKEFQIRIILSIILSVFIFANVTITLSAFFLSEIFYNNTITQIAGSETLYKVVIPVFLVVELIGLMLIFYVSLYISHRMAGPIYRLEKSVLKIGGGDFSFEVKVRKDDEFQDLASRLNEMSLSLKSKLVPAFEELNELRESSETMLKKFKNNEIKNNELIDAASEVNFLTQKIYERLSEFKLTQIEKNGEDQKAVEADE